MTTGCIGQPGFLTADQIRELDRRGHCIGSHSCSHPRRMSRLPWEQLVLEWKVSVQCLEELVRHSVTAASVPGGEYFPGGRGSVGSGRHPNFVHLGAYHPAT